MLVVPTSVVGFEFRSGKLRTSKCLPIWPRNRTSDLRVNEYELPLDRLREAPSRSGPAAGRDARRGSSRLGRASAEFPCPACYQNKRAFAREVLPEFLAARLSTLSEKAFCCQSREM